MDKIILNNMVEPKFKINDYVYIHYTTLGQTIHGGFALIKIKLKNQDVINLKLGAVLFEKICPNSLSNCLYKILEINRYKLVCKKIFYKEK